MDPLDELARQVDALEKIDDGYQFQRKARILQSLWRAEKNLPIHIEPDGTRRGACMEPRFAEQSLANFLTSQIGQVVRREVDEYGNTKVYGRPRIFNNLLSSQPLAFNLFVPLQFDLALATNVFRRMTCGRCHRVTRIDFEYSPGRRDERYLGDRSAFDVFVAFESGKGLPCFMGIEVKYHENLNNPPSGHRARYDEVARDMKCFRSAAAERLKSKPLQQVWRDHLLAGSLRLADGFADGFFVLLSPKDNNACTEAVAAYRECLDCADTFEHWTLEQVAGTIRQFRDDPWIAAFQNRYLNFTKVDCRLT